jgi:hypothetical protein
MMGYWKEFQIFCQNNQLDPHKESNQDNFSVSNKLGLPVVKGRSSSPCPDCGKPRKYGRGNWHCFYCGKDEKADATDIRIDLELEKAERARRQALALRLWDEAVSIIGTAGERYLNSRRLELPPNPDEVLRWHPSCKFGLSPQPCMVALFRDAITDKPVAVHRTCIMGAFVERMALGPIAGAAIKLWPLGNSDSLAVGEGIETVLSAIQLGHAAPPAWATSVANNMSRLPTIKEVKGLIILADNDPSRTGEIQARELRRNWIGKDVVIKMPAESGVDFNDLLRRRA